jgi:hypothetical protein
MVDSGGDSMDDLYELIHAEGEKTRRHFDRFAALVRRDIYLVLIGLAGPAEMETLRQAVTDPSLFEQTLAEYEAYLSQLEKKD